MLLNPKSTCFQPKAGSFWQEALQKTSQKRYTCTLDLCIFLTSTILYSSIISSAEFPTAALGVQSHAWVFHSSKKLVLFEERPETLFSLFNSSWTTEIQYGIALLYQKKEAGKCAPWEKYEDSNGKMGSVPLRYKNKILYCFHPRASIADQFHINRLQTPLGDKSFYSIFSFNFLLNTRGWRANHSSRRV